MGSIIGILCGITIFMKYAILNSLAYVVNKDLCRYVNKQIYLNVPRKIFACLKLYSNFEFKPEYSLGDDFPENFLIICNHQSLLDIVVFFAYFPTKPLRFISKKSLGGHVPMVSVMLKADGHCIIDRKGTPSQMMKSLDDFSVRVAKNNWNVVLFPEGTRSKTGKLGIFHAAGFRRLANNLHLPVVVFALDGGWRVGNIRKIVKNLRNGTYRLKSLKVYPAPETKDAQVKILDEAKIMIEEQLEKWRETGMLH